MTDLYPAAPTPHDHLTPEKRQYLDVLSIGFFVLAALSILFGFLPIVHVIFGVAMLGGALSAAPEALVGGAFGCIFALFGLIFMASAWIYGYFMIAAGKALRSRSRYVLCTVMAGISCMFAPFGTIVGVFAIVLLLDPQVKLAFGVTPSAATAATAPAPVPPTAPPTTPSDARPEPAATAPPAPDAD